MESVLYIRGSTTIDSVVNIEGKNTASAMKNTRQIFVLFFFPKQHSMATVFIVFALYNLSQDHLST